MWCNLTLPVSSRFQQSATTPHDLQAALLPSRRPAFKASVLLQQQIGLTSAMGRQLMPSVMLLAMLASAFIGIAKAQFEEDGEGSLPTGCSWRTVELVVQWKPGCAWHAPHPPSCTPWLHSAACGRRRPHKNAPNRRPQPTLAACAVAAVPWLLAQRDAFSNWPEFSSRHNITGWDETTPLCSWSCIDCNSTALSYEL